MSSPLSSQSPTATNAAARAVGLRKTYGSGAAAVHALDGVTVAFAPGEFTAIMGPSGCGKSTLMHCLAGLDEVSAGSVYIGETDLAKLSDRALTALRRDRLGFIFQSFNLVPTLSARENIELPSRIAGRVPDAERLERITHRFDITDRLTHRPAELSGGQQQRVACARALASGPDIIFADEPTGNLDSHSSTQVLELLRSTVHDDGQTVIMVTHDPAAAVYADRVIILADGKIVNELTAPTQDEILASMVGLTQP